MVTACGWAKHGDRISICNSPDCFVAIRPNGLSPWSDGPLGNQVSFAAADGGVAQNHVLTHFVIEGRLLNDVIASGLATIRPELGKTPCFTSAEATKPEGAIIIVDVERAKTDPARSVVSRVPAACGPARIAMSPSGNRIYVTARAVMPRLPSTQTNS